MPRKPRLVSSTGIYHVMLRGINKQKIFITNSDYQLFLNSLKQTQEDCNFKIYAYCLMPNHVHLLIQLTSESEKLEIIFKKLGTRFVFWYNKNHSRVGHLFQDRFRSEPVESEQYFRTVFRYILQNPFKAKIEQELGSYEWTSFHAYFNSPDGITDTTNAIYHFGTLQWLQDFILFTNSEDKINIHSYPQPKLSDEEAIELILKVFECNSIIEIKRLSKHSQNVYLKKLLQHNITCKQISNITGISSNRITNIKKNGLA